jgi:rhodanese-related sulfurtransferase
MSHATTPTIPAEVLERVLPDGTLVDVREPREYAAAHVPGALLVPMGQLTSRLVELDHAKPVFVICATGSRSAAMTDLLRAHGLEAYSVSGGTTAWQRSGRPVDGGVR